MKTSFPSKIRIATRRSALALWQANTVACRLKSIAPQVDVQLVKMTTKGDQLLDSPLSKIGGKGLFIKELEIAMLNNQADLAVHSMKDVGVSLPEPFILAAILERENPFDGFVSNHYQSLDQLPKGARVGTCSLRRKMQLLHYRPDLNILDLRGNVQTRLNKLDHGDYDAIILACAGLIRLGLSERITQQLPPKISLPAIGQGAIGIECPENSPILSLIQSLNDHNTHLLVQTERIINQRLQGSCQVPLAAYATKTDDDLSLETRIGSPDASRYIDYQITGTVNERQALANQASDYLIKQGALEIIQSLAND